jgi:hypothetical protein
LWWWCNLIFISGLVAGGKKGKYAENGKENG